MGSDLVVALGSATIDGQVLFGVNGYAGAPDQFRLRRFAGRSHAAGEIVAGPSGPVPQVRQTCTVLGCQTGQDWGFTCGLNEHHVAMGLASWKSKVTPVEGGLSGTDLVRLTLERSHSASNALEILTDLIARHGLGGDNTNRANDPIFLIADGQEALVVEAAGHYWAMIEVHQVRAVADVALIRQDWQRVASGLAEASIHQGWWPGGGSKVDFAGSLSTPMGTQPWALKRWGRATLLLEQQNGHIDHEVLRRMLAEHYDATVAPLAARYGEKSPHLATFVASLSANPETIPLAWCSIGPPNMGAYFPVLIDGELPDIFEPVGEGSVFPFHPTESPDSLQARWDEAVQDFAAHAVRNKANYEHLHRQATQFMQLLAAGLTRQDQIPGKARPELLHASAAEIAFVSE